MLLIRYFCRGGGIGRHAGLRNQYLNDVGVQVPSRPQQLNPSLIVRGFFSTKWKEVTIWIGG